MAFDLELEQFRKVVPKHMSSVVNQPMVDKINGLFTDQILRENYRDNLLSFASVMEQGKFKMNSYVDAVRYISCKLMGANNIQAYIKTFPDRHLSFIQNGTSEKDIASYVAAFNKGKLVNLVREQSMIAPCIFNADIFQKAINVQASLMVDEDVSPKVRSDAANSLLTHLKPPESAKVELDITVKQGSVIDELRATTAKLAQQQMINLDSGGHSIKQIADSDIIEGEFEDNA